MKKLFIVLMAMCCLLMAVNTVLAAQVEVVQKFYVGPGDGLVYKADSSSWSTVHDTSTGQGAQATISTTYIAYSGKDGSNYAIKRSFFPVDTSSLPDTAVISAGIFYFWPASKYNGDNDGDDWINVVQTTQASNTTLTTADYDKCGLNSNPVEGATRVDIGDITIGQYSGWVLNSTGLGWISKTGYTKLGLREGHDITNSPTTNTADIRNGLFGYHSEYTGTDRDPYLLVTYVCDDTVAPSVGGDVISVTPVGGNPPPPPPPASTCSFDGSFDLSKNISDISSNGVPELVFFSNDSGSELSACVFDFGDTTLSSMLKEIKFTTLAIGDDASIPLLGWTIVNGSVDTSTDLNGDGIRDISMMVENGTRTEIWNFDADDGLLISRLALQ